MHVHLFCGVYPAPRRTPASVVRDKNAAQGERAWSPREGRREPEHKQQPPGWGRLIAVFVRANDTGV